MPADVSMWVRCVMDTSDPNIKFNDAGVCNHCANFDKNIKPLWEASLSRDTPMTVDYLKIAENGRHKEFDCIIGLSDGLDSSYAAYVAVKVLGLRPLLVHVDAGWNPKPAHQR